MPAARARLNGASGVVVDAGEGGFLITAAHVIEQVRQRATEPRFHFMAGPIALDLARVIAEDRRFDVATVNVGAREVGMLERDGLQVVRPSRAEWRPDISGACLIGRPLNRALCAGL